MRDWQTARRRKEEVRARASRKNTDRRHCSVPGCPNPPRAATADGLGTRYCRQHSDQLQRHGSLFKATYTASELNPYRQAALLWLIDHEHELLVQDAIRKVEGHYRAAGQHIEASSLRGLTAAERAKAHWARLRKHQVDPRLPIAAWLAVEMILHDDLQPDWRLDYKLVQAAKVVHRMASGSHKRWVREQGGRTRVDELHAYPRPRGRVLRHIGSDLKEAAELVADAHLDAIHAFKRERDRTGSHRSSPYPKGWSARRRQP